MNYHNKKFRAVSNSENGQVDHEMIFHYQQSNNILTCTYTGKNIITGHLVGIVDELGGIEMNYHQVQSNGQIMTGKCTSTPKILENGKIRLNEKWQWTSGDLSRGQSILEEV